jgi:hypothetical protein
VTYQVKNRFQNVPFKRNLQRYDPGELPQLVNCDGPRAVAKAAKAAGARTAGRLYADSP